MATMTAHTSEEKAISAQPWYGQPPKQRVFQWIDSERASIWTLVVYSIAIAFLSLVLPIASQAMVNTIAFGSLIQPVVILALVVFVALGFSAVLEGMRTWVMEILQRRIFVRVTSVAVHRLLRVRLEAFDAGHGPELVNRFFDVVTVQKGGATLLVDGLAIVIQTVVGLLLLAVYHPFLLGFGVLILVSIIFVLFPLGRGAVATAIYESKAKYAVAAWLEELARFPATFKTEAGAKLALSRANNLAGDYLYYRGKHFRVLFRQIMGAVSLEALSSAALLAGGGWLVIERQLTLGQLVAAELVLARVVGSFSKIGKQLENYYDLLAAVDKLGYLTDLPLEDEGREPLQALPGPAKFSMSGVDFTYDSGLRVFENAACAVDPGERVAVTGPTGAGKSTLMDLICRFREPSSGRLELDGVDYRDVTLTSLRAQIQLVRDEGVINATILEDVRLGDDKLSSQDVRQALQQVGLEDQILAFPEGLETELSTGGQPLSKSQCNRLLLARAIIQKPRLLLLDEVLDALVDTPDGKALCRWVLDRSHPWSVIVITRSAEVAGMCDRQYTLVDGQFRGPAA